MCKKTLTPYEITEGITEVPMFSDKKGNLYIAFVIPNDDLNIEKDLSNPIIIYQQIKREFVAEPIKLEGTLLEIYDSDVINIQLNRDTMLFQDEVDLED